MVVGLVNYLKIDITLPHHLARRTWVPDIVQVALELHQDSLDILANRLLMGVLLLTRQAQMDLKYLHLRWVDRWVDR